MSRLQARKDLGWLAFVGYGLSTVSVALYACLLAGCRFAMLCIYLRFLPMKRVASKSASPSPRKQQA